MSNKVLIVDDEKAITEVVKSVLAKEGYDVKTATGGMEAIEAVKEFKPNILIMDVMMPDIDGWEALSILKGRGALDHIKVIMLTVVDEPKGEGAELGSYIIDYIKKPFKSGDLVERVNFVSGL